MPSSKVPTALRPWSPLSLTLIALFLGPGAVVISIRNLERFGVLDAKSGRFYLWGTVVLLACLFLLTWSFDPRAFEQTPAQQVLPISLGCPIAIYLTQFPAYHRWRVSHPDLRPRPWYTALVPILAMSAVTAVAAVVCIELFSIIFRVH